MAVRRGGRGRRRGGRERGDRPDDNSQKPESDEDISVEPVATKEVQSKEISNREGSNEKAQTEKALTETLHQESEITAREITIAAKLHSRRSPIFCAKVRKFSCRSLKNRSPAKARASRRISRFPADISFICRPSNISAYRARSNRRANAVGFVK